MNEYTEVSRLAITDILTPKFVLTVICALASKIVWQENDTVAKAAEEVLRAYRDIDTSIEELTHEKVPNSTLLFDKNVATDSSLSPIDKAVYSVLCALINPETSQCSPKVKTIAAKASCSESAVRKSLGTLEKHGVIKRKFRYLNHRQISSLYTVIMPEPSSGEQVAERLQRLKTIPPLGMSVILPSISLRIL